MSIQAVGAVLRASELPTAPRFVLLVIANYEADHDGKIGAWPSLERVARDCALSVRSVQRHIRTAEEAGELEVQYGAGPNGTNVYRVTVGGDIYVRGDNPGPDLSPEPKELRGYGSRVSSALHDSYIAPRERDALFETVAEVCKIDWHELTDSARGSLNKAVAQIRAVKGTPEEVRARAARWGWQVPLTPPALAKHWPALQQAPPTELDRAAAILAERRRA